MRSPGSVISSCPRRSASCHRLKTAIGCARGCTCGAGVVGFFREGTHEVCDARQTRQLLPATLDAVDRLVAAMHSLGVEGVREIELAENVDASHRAVHLDAATALDPRLLEQLAATDGLDRPVVAGRRPWRCTGHGCDRGRWSTAGLARASRAGVLPGEPVPHQSARRSCREGGSGWERRGRPLRGRRPFRRHGGGDVAAPGSRPSKAIGSPRPT